MPFVPVGTDTEVYDTADTGYLTDYFDNSPRNEVQQAVTGADGTGLQYFQTLTGVQAPALGCGEVDPSHGQAARLLAGDRAAR